MKCHRPKDDEITNYGNYSEMEILNGSPTKIDDGIAALDDNVAAHCVVSDNPIAIRFHTSSYYPQHCAKLMNGKSLNTPEICQLAYVCETCGKAFQTYPNLKQHTVTHVNERKFNCHLCSKVFKRSTGLNQVCYFIDYFFYLEKRTNKSFFVLTVTVLLYA